MKFKSNKGFTLIELLVVIVIIGILATLATVALSAARVKARDAKRISDIKQMQTALELYYNEENTYPPTNALVAGQALVGAVSGKTFMGKIPAGPNTGESYIYNQINGGISYTLGYTLEKPVNEFAAGAAVALPGSINNQCTPNCSGNYCGDADGCGGKCSGTLPAGAAAITGLSCSSGNIMCGSTVVSDYNKINACTSGTGAVACGATTGGCTGASNCYSGNCADFSPACTSGTALGSACGGGWLICKPNDGVTDCADSSPEQYVVVAPVDLSTATSTSAVIACANYHNAGDNNGTWSLPKLSSVATETTLSGNRTNNEMCQMMKRSNLCANMIDSSYGCYVSTLCAGLTAAQKPISGLGGTYYWSSTEYNATRAWLLHTTDGSQVNDSKAFALYVRCVRRFN